PGGPPRLELAGPLPRLLGGVATLLRALRDRPAGALRDLPHRLRARFRRERRAPLLAAPGDPARGLLAVVRGQPPAHAARRRPALAARRPPGRGLRGAGLRIVRRARLTLAPLLEPASRGRRAGLPGPRRRIGRVSLRPRRGQAGPARLRRGGARARRA